MVNELNLPNHIIELLKDGIALTIEWVGNEWIAYLRNESGHEQANGHGITIGDAVQDVYQNYRIGRYILSRVSP